MHGAISVVLFALALCGVAYLAFAIVRLQAFANRRPRDASQYPAVTVFKPMRGDDVQLFENLASFCDQDYPEFQVLFGVCDADDSAIPVIRRVIEAYPGKDLQLVIDARVRGANLKIANVMNMAEHAKHDLYVIADSDMRVDRGYLRAVVAEFSDPQTGAVTCLYNAGSAGRAAVDALGAMFVNELFAPSVLVATALQGAQFCLGATMAVRRDVLDAVGGFAALAPHLADDERLGRLVSGRGLKVTIAPYVLSDFSVEPNLGSLWRHELRWARTMLTARPLGYSFSFVTYALPLALIALAISRDVMWGLVVVAAAAVLRVALQYSARRALKARGRAAPWLIPIRDFLGLAEWAASFFTRTVRWRDRTLRVDRHGQIV